MITEVATLTINPDDAAAFEKAVADAAPLFQSSEGCRAMALERVIEEPARYRLIVRWDSVEHHTVTFRNSENFSKWRALASPFFTAAPEVEHTDTVATYF